MDEKITIIDVARKAGLSKGTVDRVLHNRGEVSAKSAEKVRKAIEALDYHPNMHASLLASRKAKVIACLMPNFKSGEFWGKVYEGLMNGSALVNEKNIRIEFFFYNQYSVDEFNAAASDLLKSEPEGVIMPTLFREATYNLTSRLSEAKIPYAYIDTKVEEDTNHLAFIGMPRHDSGTLCGALLTERVPIKDVDNILIVRIKRDVAGMSDPTAKRREGFVSYINTHFPKATIHQIFIDPSDNTAIQKEMSSYFSKHPDTRFIVMFNSRLHLLAKSLADFPVKGRRVIGFDDLPQNLSMLKEGLADVIVAQHIEDNCAKLVEILSDFILTHKYPVAIDNYAHIDIITKFNIENY